MTRYRLVLVALMFAALAVAAPRVYAQAEHAPATPAAAQHDAAKPADQHEAAAAEHGAEESHDPGWMPTVWKAANFVILIGVLGYFLRAPLNGYLDGRIAKVREDLVTAAQTRETAVRQLAEIDAKLAALPGEIEMRLRVAKRELLELAANLAVNVAAERIRSTITPDDQTRLVDRYASQLKAGAAGEARQ